MKLLKGLALCIPAYSAGEVFDLPKGQKGNAFCWLCIVVSGEAFKYMDVLWYSKHAEIHSTFTKNREVFCGSSPCSYHTVLDEQQL